LVQPGTCLFQVGVQLHCQAQSWYHGGSRLVHVRKCGSQPTNLGHWGAIAAHAHDPKAPSWQAGSFPAKYCTALFNGCTQNAAGP
jgi:hypothetical protein